MSLTKGGNQIMQQRKPRNEEDFREYYQVAFTTTKYYDNLMDILATKMDLNRSQVLRKAIYEMYQKYKQDFEPSKDDKKDNSNK
jgi:hypothetical protein